MARIFELGGGIISVSVIDDTRTRCPVCHEMSVRPVEGGFGMLKDGVKLSLTGQKAAGAANSPF